MKPVFRIVELPNGKFMCQAKKPWWFSWRGVFLGEMETLFCDEVRAVVLYVKPKDDLYLMCQERSVEAAQMNARYAEAFEGEVSNILDVWS